MQVASKPAHLDRSREIERDPAFWVTRPSASPPDGLHVREFPAHDRKVQSRYRDQIVRPILVATTAPIAALVAICYSRVALAGSARKLCPVVHKSAAGQYRATSHLDSREL